MTQIPEQLASTTYETPNSLADTASVAAVPAVVERLEVISGKIEETVGRLAASDHVAASAEAEERTFLDKLEGVYQTHVTLLGQLSVRNRDLGMGIKACVELRDKGETLSAELAGVEQAIAAKADEITAKRITATVMHERDNEFQAAQASTAAILTESPTDSEGLNRQIQEWESVGGVVPEQVHGKYPSQYRTTELSLHLEIKLHLEQLATLERQKQNLEWQINKTEADFWRQQALNDEIAREVRALQSKLHDFGLLERILGDQEKKDRTNEQLLTFGESIEDGEDDAS